jgi:hypothetical protein
MHVWMGYQAEISITRRRAVFARVSRLTALRVPLRTAITSVGNGKAAVPKKPAPPKAVTPPPPVKPADPAASDAVAAAVRELQQASKVPIVTQSPAPASVFKAAVSQQASGKTPSSVAKPVEAIEIEPTPLTLEEMLVSEPIPTVTSASQTAPAHVISSPVSASPTDYQGIAQAAFKSDAAKVLLAPLDAGDVEIKPDGVVYLPEIKYRRRLNLAFGPGAWAMKPCGPATVSGDLIFRTYQLYCLGRFVAEATGEQNVRQGMTQATAEEAAKSNALMRCCKDLGIASELWDPTFIQAWRAKHAVNVWCTNTRTNEKRQLWRKTTAPPFPYPWKEA